ncbi:MAG: LysM peptidoglycan-binding domain-containing protein [Smithellaceae bacterium]|nr:LysM peptidoglycan-binding domain-containing protein [Smithellaceae bacterium]NLX51432.1 LysM peptidoglycan-binding domain-containing protein [Deltaproteobacteria bacterium]
MTKRKKNNFFICLIVCCCAAIVGFATFEAQAWELPLFGFSTNPQATTVAQSSNAAQNAFDAAPGPATSPAAKTKAQDEEDKEAVEEEEDLMERALELLEIADTHWKSGDVETTLNTLDKAYALVLDTNGDVEIARQKDDLRLLIARRILTLYSSQEKRTNGKASEIPHLMNADVEKEIRSFQGPEREFFIASYHRSGMYRELIVTELKKAGIPEELFWLPLVESGFKVSALSSARALGLWQFIPSTGYKFGLTRDEWVDERMDILKSTQAAIAYLKELHSMFGDWLTVLAAYNCGEGRVLRVISRQHINYFDRFWDLYSQLPNETARYVPRFLATLHIVRNPEKYGFDLQASTVSLNNYEAVKVDKMMKLSDIAEKMEMPEDVMALLNAELRYKITPNREYSVRIPQGTLQKFNMVYNEIPETEKPRFTFSRANYLRHRVRSGETVTSIAKRYRVSTASLYDCNKINKRRKLVKGRIIRIPVSRVETAGVSSKPSPARKSAASTAVKTYKVKRGDSLLGIARKFNIPVARLKEVNRLKGNSIQAGRVLKIPRDEAKRSEEDQPGKADLANKASEQTEIAGKTLSAKDIADLGVDKHIVTKGENLTAISRKYNIALAKLMQINRLSGEGSLTPGQVLVIK